MSKTILATVDGFTPIIDTVVLDVGLMAAAVFGKVWRYCQMQDGVCKASQERIAEELGISRKTVNTHVNTLVDAGYLIDTTPEALGIPHIYGDTGKAGMAVNISATSEPVTNLPTGCNNFTQGGVTFLHSKKELKKQKDYLLPQEAKSGKIFAAYESNIGTLTPMIADELKDLDETYSEEWLLKAIGESVLNEKRNLKYVAAILKRWKVEGFQSKKQKSNSVYRAPGVIKQTPMQAQEELKEWLSDKEAAGVNIN